MATFDQITTISLDKGFQARVQYAATIAAENVYNELTNTPGHVTRASYATKVLNGGLSNLAAVALSILTNPTIAAEANPANPPDFSIPDSDIQFAMNSIWNSLAGV